jgi:hypothetical protein
MFDLLVALVPKEEAGSPWISMIQTTTKTGPTMTRKMEMLTDRRERRKDNGFSVRDILHAISASQEVNILLGIFESIQENDHSSVIAAGAFRAWTTFVSTPKLSISTKKYPQTRLLLLELASSARYGQIEFAQLVDLEPAQ